MRKIFRIGIVVFAVTCLMLALAVISSAYHSGEYGDTPFIGVDDDTSDFDTPLIPINAVWRVTHDNGYTEYSSTFLDGFNLVREGSVMKLIPDRIEVNIASTYTVPTNTKYTIDLGSSTLVFTNKDIRAAALLFNRENDVTVISDGARVFLQEATSSFMTFNGNSRLTVFGGEGKLSVWAPDALELGDNAHAELHDVYFYKNHGNMRAVLGVRGNSSVEIYDSLLFTEQNRVAILMQTNGKATLTDTAVISADNTNILDFEGNGIAFKTYGRCYFYGRLAGTPKNVSLFDEVYTNFEIKSEYLADAHTSYSASVTKTFATSKFTSPDQSVASPTTASFTFRVMNEGRLTDEMTEQSVWRIDDADGSTVGYADTFYYPFKSFKLTAGMRLTLLRDITEPVMDFTASLDGELTIDLGDNVIMPQGSADLSEPWHLFSFNGEGRVNILGEKSKIILKAGGAFLQLGGYVSADIFLGDSCHIIDRLASAVRGDITVCGGTVSTADGFIVNDYGNVTLDGAFIMTDTAEPLKVGGGLTLKASAIITNDGSVSCASLFADSSSLVGAAVNSSSVSAEAGARFCGTVGGRSDFFLRDDRFVLEAARPEQANGELVWGDIESYEFNYIAVSAEGNIMASMTLAGSATLNIYVPVFVANGAQSVTLRIVHDGLVYSEGTVRSRITVDGTEYFAYSYPYIYQNTLLEKTRIELLCDGIHVRIEISPKELLLSSVEDCEDESILRGVAAYLNYALLASGDPDAAAALEPIAEYLPEERTVYTPKPESECLRSVYFNADASTLDFYPREGVKVGEIRFSYGGKQMSALPDKDGVVRVPMYRLDNRESLRIIVNDGDDDSLLGFNLIELYAIVSASPSRSAELFGRYIAYLMAI